MPALSAAITIAVVVAAVSSLGHGHRAEPSVPGGPPAAVIPVTPRERSNEQLAWSDASQLLSRIKLPAGAVRATRDLSAPAQLGVSAGGILPGGNQVDVHEFWRVPGKPSAVNRWIESHPPAGAVNAGSGSSGKGGVRLRWWATFGYRPLPGRVSLRELNVTTAAARRGGTAVRADGEAVWVVPRPKRSFVPDTVDRIEWSTAGATRSTIDRTFTSRATVREIVGWLNAVPLARPDLGTACYSSQAYAHGFRLRLLAPGHLVPVATATWPPCGVIGLDLGGRRYYLRLDPGLPDTGPLISTFMSGSPP